ncbi:MAG: ammonium transporter [Desulfarculaceae bacterium]|nr:ammonium transporter [Desulfarculaceae bacterium]MCF8048901.1 ammonium transporter [Desulfarculaceae bacterium]MCF8064719.1 ammonium transporter [Desulfarculaceae bacterium]MCF8097209.1 ammonium transporter [Desulfarculaceae bacterium]MCF8122754.1 ammonium transporter [Desulfarculaceae bacterium]
MANPISAGDTAWILTSTALVLLMTPGLAFFYGGMVRKKNILSTLNLSFIMMGVISVQWVLYGYTLAFGNNVAGLFGDLSFLGFSGVTGAPGPYADKIPHLAFAAFQMMFAVITPALITGAFVERIRFKTFLVFAVLWATIVYDPLCHWVWGDGGWMGAMGALDFAGGTVVHIAAGFSALAFAIAIGPRKGFPKAPMEPHNIPYTVLGAGLLWFGWFGFNAGSSLAADGLASYAFVNTNTAAASAAVCWMLVSWADAGKPSVLGIATGAVVGLVAITPAAGFVTPLGAIVIGAVGAPISYYAIRFRQKRNLDESLDVWACHGMAGTWGALATGLFAAPEVNEAAGLFYGNPGQLGIQAISVVVTICFVFLVTYVLAKILGSIMGLRVETLEEEVGLDLSEHGERAYS